MLRNFTKIEKKQRTAKTKKHSRQIAGIAAK